jgi:Mn-dependent DtxR family transcriptional regulator
MAELAIFNADDDFEVQTDELVTVQELAERLGVHPNTIRNLIKEYGIPVFGKRVVQDQRPAAEYSWLSFQSFWNLLEKAKTAEGLVDQSAGQQVRSALQTEEGRARIVASFNMHRLALNDISQEEFVNMVNADPKALELVEGLSDKILELSSHVESLQIECRSIDSKNEKLEAVNGALEQTFEKLTQDSAYGRLSNVKGKTELTPRVTIDYCLDTIGAYCSKLNMLRYRVQKRFGLTNEELDRMQEMHTIEELRGF